MAPVRRHLPALFTAAAVREARRGRNRRALVLGILAAAGFGRTYVRGRQAAGRLSKVHRARMARVDQSVLDRYYVEAFTSHEEEMSEYPAYDRRKHDQRYELLTRTARGYLPAGGTVVDIGCGSAIVLDRLAPLRPGRMVGVDLNPYGLRQRIARANPPLLIRGVMEALPLQTKIADVVVASEVIEHLIDASAGMHELARITRPGGLLVMTTNNSAEMPEVSPLRDPGAWVERLLGGTRPALLSFRHLTWDHALDPAIDSRPPESPTHAPHVHFAFAELRDMAADAGLRLVSRGSFEFPAPQSRAANTLRQLTERSPAAGNFVSDALERGVAALPGLRMMGTHHLLIFRREGLPTARKREWWPAQLAADGAAQPQPVA